IFEIIIIMSFYIDTEPSEPADEAAAAAAASSFYIDTSKQNLQQKQDLQQLPPIGRAAAAQESRRSTGGKRKRPRVSEIWDPAAATAGGEAKLFYRSVSSGELGAGASADGAIDDPSADAPPKMRRSRFSRAALNSRFFDSIAASAEDGTGGVGQGELGGFRPGVLSERLRSALGLEPDELPNHVYRMRELGYPPGWLLEARFQSSGVTIIDDDANNRNEARPEAGEVKYDVSKLVKFPGFNCPLPHGVRDEHRRLGYPSMRLDDHLSTFVHWLAGRNQIHAVDAYHTRRVREAAAAERDKSGRNSAAAGEEDTDEQYDNNDAEEEEEADLDDLEAQRMELLRQLEENGDLEELDSCSDRGEDCNSRDAEDKEKAEDHADLSSSLVSPVAVVSTQFGSPVFASYKGAAKLPDQSSFNRDIEQFRPFENLPNAVGGYTKVNAVVKKIRESLPKIA
ncbi:hypothetical protein BOX15_Mlig020813g1, partial [Macrostomum lignano]